MENQIYISKAPARICLFGDHQDYLNLPIIACAINRYIQIEAVRIESNEFKISLVDLDQTISIPLNSNQLDIDQDDFLRIALRVLKKYGCVPSHGLEIKISGDIPINAGLSSSSALTVAWIQLMVEVFGIDLPVNQELYARLAYETEVLERGSSGGKMDQYTIGLGGMIYMDTANDHIDIINHEIEGMIIGVSGVAKNTFGTLADLKGKAWTAISQIKEKHPTFNHADYPVSDLPHFSKKVNPELRDIFIASKNNHEITKKAKIALGENDVDLNKIGNLMNQHHYLLKNNLHITVPKIDAMIDASILAGALGAKIVGSGGGGCIVAISPKGNEQKIINSILEAGAIDAFQVYQSSGVSMISNLKT